MKILSLLLVIILCCSGCAVNEGYVDNTEIETNRPSDETATKISEGDEATMENNKTNSTVSLELCSDEKKISTSHSEIEVKLVNNSEQDILTGEVYTIEIFCDNEWVEIPISISYEDIEYTIAVGEEKKFVCMLEGILESGLYRIKKSYSIDSKNEPSLIEYVYANFQI